VFLGEQPSFTVEQRIPEGNLILSKGDDKLLFSSKGEPKLLFALQLFFHRKEKVFEVIAS